MNPWGFTDAELVRYHETLAEMRRRDTAEVLVERGRRLAPMRRAYRVRRRRRG